MQKLINSYIFPIFKFRKIKVKRVIKGKLPPFAELKNGRRGKRFGQLTDLISGVCVNLVSVNVGRINPADENNPVVRS